MLEKTYKLCQSEESSEFLGIKIRRDENELRLSQTQYILETLEEFGVSTCNPVETPMEVGFDLSKSFVDSTLETMARSIIGRLLFISEYTRPDITYVVNYSCPNTNFVRLLTSSMELNAFCDIDKVRRVQS